MRLLVSVSSAAEARAARAGGAHVIDAKDPSAGALGSVTLETFGTICAAAHGAQLSAAIGDAGQEDAVEARAAAFTRAGASFVKLGFAGVARREHAAALLAAATRGARNGALVPVAYADAARVAALPPYSLLALAASTPAAGLLLDTADKSGAGIRGLLTDADLEAWIRRVRDAGLFAAIAGRLTLEDVAIVRAMGADIAGVRGAACIGGRTGGVDAGRVHLLRASADGHALDAVALR